jgi:integrase
MSQRSPRLPKYRHYRPKNLGVVRIDGRDFYLGAFNSPESWEKYRRLVAEWLTAGRVDPPSGAAPAADAGPSVGDVILAFWRHAERYYRTPDGQLSGELGNVRDALRPLRKLYGTTPARSFGPLALRAVRDEMVRAGLARTTVNAWVNRVRRVFRWAASVELVPASVAEALATVEGLRAGRTEARETEGVGPAPMEHVEAALPFMPRPVAAMVRLQLWTGCRPGEAVVMRGCDLTPGEPVWEYRPARHKNAWRGRGRVITLGPRAQELVREFLKPDLNAYLFAPADAVAESAARRRAARRSKPTPRQLARRAAAPGSGHARRYTVDAYGHAVRRACRAAGVPVWSPGQLRHTAATAIRSRYGLETAQVVLGHARADVTQIYAERDLAKVRGVMAEIG